MVQSSMVSDIVAIHKRIRFIRGSDIAESVSVDIVVTYE